MSSGRSAGRDLSLQPKLEIASSAQSATAQILFMVLPFMDVKRLRRLSAAIAGRSGDNTLTCKTGATFCRARLGADFYAVKGAQRLEAGRFAAVRSAERAPDAKSALTGQIRTGRRVGKSVGIDRVGNKANGTVEHTDVDAAAVIARRRENFDLTLLLVVLEA